MSTKRSESNTCIWFSGATDKTGKRLAEDLKISGNTKKPSGVDVVIGWGTKTKKDVSFPSNVHVFNHPDNIKANRNKFTALGLMAEAEQRVAVKPFVAAKSVMAALDTTTSDISLPLIGRRNYHQGGAGFWLCLTKSMVNRAIEQGCQYFQNFIDIEHEFRLHIVNGKLIYAQKKVERDNMEEAFIAQTTDNVKNAAERNGTQIDESTLELAAKQMAKKQSGHADLVVRSNTRGYRFSNVKLSSVNKNLMAEALKALEALKLQFGAVDCCIDTDGSCWIIEVNTGPGLEGTSLKRYIDALGEMIDKALNPPKPKKATKPKTTKKKTAKTTETNNNESNSKSKLEAKIALMQEMAGVADDEEAETLRKVFAKMFGE